MSDVTPKAENVVSIEIDGQKMDVEKGSMIIQAADQHNIKIPRFCYHKKLSIAANCRMCMVDVEKAPKPMPACATPVMDGMKIYTQSRRATDAQRNVMEFLLINHPLDCPICDQGGECELQDVSMGYGRDISRYQDSKRVVSDENLGSLVATDMTRCILCTRCVRFLNEIAGTDELGGIGRGDRTSISTAVGESVDSELSGNIIDLCPVGALTNKPFRYKARVWELTANAGVSMHDATGSNIYYHAKQGKILRSVPKENEQLNQNWLADRDRYAIHGLNTDTRLLQPEFKHNGKWQTIEWDEALKILSQKLSSVSGDQIRVLASSYCSTEEYLLLKQLFSGLGCDNLEHRIRQTDIQAKARMPRVDVSLSDIEHVNQIVLIGAYVRHEQPLVNHRIRQAWLKGAKISSFSHQAHKHNFDLLHDVVGHAKSWVEQLGSLAHCLADRAGEYPSGVLGEWIKSQSTDEDLNHLAKLLLKKDESQLFVIGQIANAHPQAELIKATVAWISQIIGGSIYEMAEGSNAVGATLAGISSKQNVLDEEYQVNVLYQAEFEDFSDPKKAIKSFNNSNFSVSFNAFSNDSLRSNCDLLLPIALLPELTGSVFNNLRQRQLTTVASKSPGQCKPGWRVLRVLGNLLDLEGFDYEDVGDLLDKSEKLQGANGIINSDPKVNTISDSVNAMYLSAQRAMYDSDQLSRASEPLQKTVHASTQTVWLHPQDVNTLGLNVGTKVTLKQGESNGEFLLSVDEDLPLGSVFLQHGNKHTLGFNLSDLSVEIMKMGEVEH